MFKNKLISLWTKKVNKNVQINDNSLISLMILCVYSNDHLPSHFKHFVMYYLLNFAYYSERTPPIPK